MRRTIVGARELKTRLGTYLRHVREGNTLLITDRGEPVAELRPITPASSADEALIKLSKTGAISLPRRKSMSPFRPLRSKGGPVSQAIIEDREDRF